MGRGRYSVALDGAGTRHIRMGRGRYSAFPKLRLAELFAAHVEREPSKVVLEFSDGTTAVSMVELHQVKSCGLGGRWLLACVLSPVACRLSPVWPVA